MFTSEHSKNLLLDFCSHNGLKFKDISLLELAFIHRSCDVEVVGKKFNNERLEFLGDSILGLVAAQFLFENLKTHPEGDLAKIKGVVVSEHTLCAAALKMGIDKCLQLGKGEEQTGGRHKNAILADCTEAVIAAVYLDSGFDAAKKFVLSFLASEVEKVIKNKGEKDYKTILQEKYQKQTKNCPVYELIKTQGPDHERTFWVTVTLGGKVYGPKSGKSKKQAQQNVAKLALEDFYTKNK